MHAGSGLRDGGTIAAHPVSSLHKPCLNEFGAMAQARRFVLPRSLVIIAAIALAALVAGFLAFGGGNMGH